MITAAIYNSSLKAKGIIPERTFLPDYFNQSAAPAKAPAREYTMEEQHARMAAFKAKLRAVSPRSVKDKSTNVSSA